MSTWFHIFCAWWLPKASKRQALPCTAMLLGLWMWAGQAGAHLMPAQQGSLHVQGSTVLAMVALPVSALIQVDDDGDGRLSDIEVQAHLDSIKNQVKARFRLFKGDTPGRVDQLQVLAEEDERTPPLASGPTALAPSAGAAYFLMLMKVSFVGALEPLRLETDLFGSVARERQLTLKITRGEDTEAVVLTPWRTTHQLFRSPLQVLLDYTRVGMEHIVWGWDHLTFLLTVLVAASGWRYWWRVLTGFTVAHSITLTATLFGFLQAPTEWVEPLIAASIVLMAGLNLVQHRAVLGQRLLLVFACGLLHGMGFASAISDLGLHGAYQWTSILGFNVGIELGQILILLAFLAVSKGLGHVAWAQAVHQRMGRFTLERWVSALALGVGVFWLVERLME
jgi:hydrogenase/urease accessory protein HupE